MFSSNQMLKQKVYYKTDYQEQKIMYNEQKNVYNGKNYDELYQEIYQTKCYNDCERELTKNENTKNISQNFFVNSVKTFNTHNCKRCSDKFVFNNTLYKHFKTCFKL